MMAIVLLSLTGILTDLLVGGPSIRRSTRHSITLVSLGHLCVMICVGPQTPGLPEGFEPKRWSATWHRWHGIGWLPSYTERSGIKMLAVPLWLIALPSGAGSFLLWRSLRRERLRAPLKPCPKCGYSLVGLAEGAACPECGKGGEPRPAASV
jgi:hypothetical protein